MSVLSALLLLALGTLVVAHLAIAVGLARRGPWWRAAVALVVPPLAPVWAFRTDGMRARAYVWVGALAVYAGGVAIA